MKGLIPGAALVCAALAYRAPAARAHPPARPACEPGFQIVEEVCYKDVVTKVCKVVPNMKKRWVYSAIDDPFCVPALRHPHSGDHCLHCNGPHCRKQLVKKEVEYCDGMKCVTEDVVTKVRYVIHHKVPCGPGVPMPGAPPGGKAPRGEPIPAPMPGAAPEAAAPAAEPLPAPTAEPASGPVSAPAPVLAPPPPPLGPAPR